MHAAQMWRSDDEIPSVLLPANKRAGTASPINGPAMYHGHGWRKSSNSIRVADDSKTCS